MIQCKKLKNIFHNEEAYDQICWVGFIAFQLASNSLISLI